MKLRVMQQGGGLIYTPFIPQQQATTAAGSSSSSSDEAKLDPLDKEILSLMKDQNLLPSDIQQIYNRLIRFQKQTQNLSSLGGTEAYRSAMPGMLQILGLVNEAKYNKAQSDDVMKKMASENASADVALDSYGRMYVWDKDGKIEKVSSSEFDNSKHTPVSNSELLSMRQRQFGFQDGIMNDLENMVGMSTVQAEIAKIINNIGSAEASRYVKSPSANKVIQALMEDGPEGIYKLSQKDRSEGLQPAWNAIYQQLPQNMRNLLRANAAILNTDPILLIQDTVLRNTDTKSDISYDSSASKAAGFDTGTGGSSSGTQVKDTYAERLVTGNGLAPARLINIMPANSGITLKAYAQDAFSVVKDGNALPVTNLQFVLTQADALGGITKRNSITFGDQLIDEADWSKIMVKTDNMVRAVLPIRYTEDGRIVPDFEAQQKLEMARTKAGSEGYSEAWIRQWLAENLPNARYNSETQEVEFDPRFVRPFIILHGVAPRNRIGIDVDTPYLTHLSGSEGAKEKELYETAVGIQTVGTKVEKTGNKGAARWKYYSGNIYLPISDSTVGAALYNNQYYPQNTYTDITQKATANEMRRGMITNFDYAE